MRSTTDTARNSRPGRRAPRAVTGGTVGVVLAVTGAAYTVVAVARAGSWWRFSGLEATTAAAFGALLVALVWTTWRERDPERLRFRRRFEGNAPAVFGLTALIVLMALAVLAPVLSSADPTAMGALDSRYAPPGAAHPLGTDRFGRDVWARVAHGGRSSLTLCALAIGLAVAIGTLVGSLAGVARARVDDVVMRVVDGMLAFPRILFLMTVVAVAPPGPLTLGLALAATGWMGIARIVRGELRRMREREFVEAAIAAGVGKTRLVWRHLLPNATGHVVVAATLNAGTVILLESSLSFLGLGVQPPTPSWGAMVFEGRDALGTAWWVSACPALAITVSVVALNLVGDGLRDALEPRVAPRSPR
jgi:peptide/nickel transport system permease protein